MFKTFIYIILIIALFSCSDSVKKRDIINEDIFFNLLIDMHKADGIISDMNLTKDKKSDSISVYNSVLKKNNVSREDFDKTIKYYSLHTDEYLLIYDSLENLFDSIQSELTKKRINNLWNKNQKWSFNTLDFKNPLDFDIKEKKYGEYILKAGIFVAPYDEHLEKKIKLYANYDDESVDSSTNIKKIKDLKQNNYEFLTAKIITDKRKTLKSISGTVIKFDNTEKKRIQVKDIELLYKKIRTKDFAVK